MTLPPTTSTPPTTMRATLATVFVPVGATFLAVGVLVGLPVFGVSAFGFVGVILGALLLIAGSLLMPANLSTSSTPTRHTRRLLPLLSPAVLIIGLSAVHLLDRAGFAIDVTASDANTLAEESLLVARGLDRPVQIVSFVDDDRALLELRTLVDRYRMVAPHLTFEQRSIKRADDLDRARELGVAEHIGLGGPNLVVTTPSAEADAIPPVRLRFVAGLPDAEQLLTNALRRVTTTTVQRLYLLSGHGEADPRDDGPLGMSRLSSSLQARGVQLVPLPLLSVGRLPDDAKGLVLLPALTPIGADEQGLVTAAVEAGLPVFVAVEPDHPSPLSTRLAASLGVDVVDDVVVDESPFSAMVGGADLASGQTQLAHAVTRSLRGALTHFARAAVLGITPVGEEGDVIATPLVSTGSDARAQKTAASGTLPLLVSVERQRPIKARALVAADASFLDNANIGKGANSDLALNALLWLTSTDDAIVVRPRQKTGALVFMTPGGRATLTFVLLVAIPALLLALAVGLSALRRSR